MTKKKKEHPWKRFYPSDWQGDEGLQMCCLAARGLWIEMLNIMWANSGYLKIGDMPIEETHLSRKVGADIDQVRTLIQELENFGVFSRTRTGVIYSRRIVNDEKKSKINRDNAQKGTLSKSRKNNGKFSSDQRKSSERGSEQSSPIYHIPDKKEKNTKKEKSPIWFDGKIIRLNRKDYDEMFTVWSHGERTPQNDDAFMDFLTGRDNWLAEQAINIRKNWFISTWKYVRKQAGEQQ